MRILFASILVTIILTMTTAMAEESQSQQALDPQDVRKVQEGAQALGKLFGVEQETPKPNVAATTNQPVADVQPKKSMADVADKVVDLTTDAIATIASSLQKVAPNIWKIMILQQYVKGVQMIIVPFGIIIVALTFRHAASKYWWPEPLNKEDALEESDDNRNWRLGITRAIPMAIAFLCGIWFVQKLSDAVGYMINPYFYAIQDLIKTILMR